MKKLLLILIASVLLTSCGLFRTQPNVSHDGAYKYRVNNSWKYVLFCDGTMDWNEEFQREYKWIGDDRIKIGSKVYEYRFVDYSIIIILEDKEYTLQSDYVRICQ